MGRKVVYGSAGTDFLQILAGAKCASGAGQEEGTDAVFPATAAERILKLGRHLGVDAIEDIRPIQRDARDALSDLECNEAIGHRRFSEARGQADKGEQYIYISWSKVWSLTFQVSGK